MTFDINTFSTQSPTAVICENAQLFGATPEPGEHDPRDVWDRDNAIEAVGAAIRILAEGVAPDGFQLADECESLLSGIVNAFDAQMRRVDKLTPKMREPRPRTGRHRDQRPRLPAREEGSRDARALAERHPGRHRRRQGRHRPRRRLRPPRRGARQACRHGARA